MTLHKAFTLICIAALVLLTVGLTALESLAAGQETKRVFILHSYHKGYPFSDNEMRGIDNVFDKSDIKIENYVTYMDVKRIPPTPQYFDQLKDLIKGGYKGVRFDAVLTCDNDALEFMRKYRDELFPGVPVVFTGINDYDERMLDGRRDLTGTIERSDYAGTISLAQKLRPETKNIVVVTDKTTTGKALRSELEKVRPDFPQSLRFIDLSFADMPLDELTKKLSRLSSDSIVFLLQHFVDREGNSHPIKESTLLLAKSSAVPVFVVSDSRMGLGVLGGHLVSGHSQGETAAQIAVKILGGTDVRSIPVMLDSPNRYMFDYSVMQRFNISERNLPQGSILINKPVSVLDEYRPQLFTILGAFIVLSGILVYLLLEIRRRKRAEEAIRESEERFRHVTESLQEAVWSSDPSGKFNFLSPIMAHIYGRPLSEMMGNPDFWIEASHPDDQVAVHASKEKLFHDYRVEIEYRIILPDGTVRWIADRKLLLRNEHGEPSQIAGIISDITERKRAEVALQESRSLTETVVEHVPLMIFLKEATDLRFVIFNRAGEELLGYDRKDLLGKNNLDLFPPEQAAHFMAKDHDVLDGETGILDIPEEPIMTAKKGQRLLHTRKVCIRGADGVTKYLLGISEDITDRKQAEAEKRSLEERLSRAEKMEALGTLAGGVAHDLNNVLGIVVGYSEMILDGVDKSSPFRHGLENIMSGGLKAAAIVDDLLTLARRGVTGRSILNLNKIIGDCQKSPEFVNLSFHNPSVKIKTDLEADLLNIAGSSVHLGKSLYNLVSNASEAMAKGGTVTIKTTNQYLDKPIQGYDQIREGDYVVLSVSDTGEGISSNDLKRIFEPFYTKKIMGRSGTGLGLAVVWGTVKDHQGYINVQSEEGNGSTFTLYFPVTREEITNEAVAVAISEYMGNGESILVVDDIKEQRDLATSMLRTLNYSVTSVSSGEDAVEYLKEHQTNLMVLDMIMDPGMDGLDTYRSILEICPKQKAIIVSGFSESDRVHDAQELGAGAYIRKPYIIEKLGLAVRKELDRK